MYRKALSHSLSQLGFGLISKVISTGTLKAPPSTRCRANKALLNITLASCVAALSACAEPPKTGAELAQSLLIIDTHIDVPYRLKLSYADVSRATDSGDFDYPRAMQGGLNAPFMSIYIPAKVDEAGGAFALADELIDSM